MFCTKCGAQLSDDCKFCNKCGAPFDTAEQKDTITTNAPCMTEPEQTSVPAPQPQQHVAEDDGIFGILGFVFAFSVPFVGLILSLMGWRKTKHRGLALAGIILSTFILVVIIIFVAFGLANMNDTSIPILILISAFL
ncbi:MAG: zinc-ribbon domain-containing protein [Clostridiales bacterium]|nr:zinc-ribbon domain-containing protein [Clostridiales bacterium]